MIRSLYAILISAVCYLFLPGLSYAQGTNVSFGQNRVQYHDFTWQYYESENFVTYNYLGGQGISEFVVQLAEAELPNVEEILDYKLNTKIEILVFNDISDLNQSNIGVGREFYNTGGITRIIGNKIFLHFDGNHQNMRRQLRQGMAQVLLNNMMFGGSIQDVIQNAVLLNLPGWFVDGLISYVGERWNTDWDSRLRDGMATGRFRNFNKLSGTDAQLAGHSFWYYVSENYGEEDIPNLLYLTRINRSLENGFLFVLGFSYRQAIEEWKKFFIRRYKKELEFSDMPADTFAVAKKDKKIWDYRQVRIHPNGKQIAYAVHDLGAWKVYLTDIETGKHQRIAKGGFKTKSVQADMNYPLLAYDPLGRTLVIIYEHRDVVQLMTYNLQSGEKEVRDLTRFERITHINFANDGNTLVLSAINRGQSDIYTYNIRSRATRQITNDFYDDLMPAFAEFGDRQGILFISNRENDTLVRLKQDSTLPIGNFDLYFYNQLATDSRVLARLTNTPLASESYPQQLDSMHFTYLSDVSGVRNRYTGYIDEVFARNDYYIYYPDSIVLNPPDYNNRLLTENDIFDSTAVIAVYKDTGYVEPTTNYTRNIIEQDIAPRTMQAVELVMLNGKFEVLIPPSSISFNEMENLPVTAFAEKEWLRMRVKQRREKANQTEGATDKIPEEETPDYFQTEYIGKDSSSSYTGGSEQVFYRTRVKSYKVKFSTDYVLTQLDNGIILEQYQQFVGNGPVYDQQSLSGLITISLSDLMENHRITGGFRVPTNFSGSEYFLAYDNLEHRLDKKALVYRKVDIAYYDPGNILIDAIRAKQKTNYFEISGSYPLDVLRSIRVKAGYRSYKLDFSALENNTLELPPITESWLRLRTEYVFDNTYEVGLNILNGTRYKFFGEVQKQFEVAVDPGIKVDFAKGILSVLGFDVRHYQKVHRNIVWATRLSGAKSLGTRKLIYYLGGVDGWLFPRFNQEIDVNFDNNYAYQTLATPMRGFRQNIRNGNAYALVNTELRVPVFSYLVQAPIRSEFVRNFQLIAFTDIGSAWEGATPYSDDNPFNIEQNEEGPVEIEVKYFKNPIVGGYGWGARTLLFGYFVRFDMAWGVENGAILDPRYYISLNLDF